MAKSKGNTKLDKVSKTEEKKLPGQENSAPPEISEKSETNSPNAEVAAAKSDEFSSPKKLKELRKKRMRHKIGATENISEKLSDEPKDTAAVTTDKTVGSNSEAVVKADDTHTEAAENADSAENGTKTESSQASKSEANVNFFTKTAQKIKEWRQNRLSSGAQADAQANAQANAQADAKAAAKALAEKKSEARKERLLKIKKALENARVKTAKALKPIGIWLGKAYIVISRIGEYLVSVLSKIARYIGLCLLYLVAVIYRGLTYLKQPFADFFKRIGEFLSAPFKRHKKARKLGSSEIAKARQEKGFWGGLAAWFKVAGRTVFGKRGLLATAVNWGLPVVSCVFLINIIGYANSQNYALKLTVNGDFVGYINDENAFTEAEKMVQNRINYTGSSIEIISFDPAYEVENVGSGTLLNQYQVADKLLKLLGKEVKEGYGLYLGDSYYGTLSSHAKLDQAIKDLLAKYSTGAAKETVQLDKNISYISGTYLADSFVDEDKIVEQFMGNKKVATYYTVKDGDDMDSVVENTDMTVDELKNLNPDFGEDYEFTNGNRLKITQEEPFLTVMVTREISYTEAVEYETEYVDDDTAYAGNKFPQNDGENGECSIVANVSYINGNEVNRRIVSKEITKEPVTEVILVGTKPRQNDTAPEQEVGAGLMLWPVGGYDGGRIEEPVWWHGGYSGHRGIDIEAPAGTPVYAAENGVVTGATYDGSYNGGRGNMVIIQGDSGYTTYYYHNREVVATVGQRVTAGDVIAYVGTTGESYGYHCHFGVSIGDEFLNPTDYLPWHERTPECAAKEY